MGRRAVVQRAVIGALITCLAAPLGVHPASAQNGGAERPRSGLLERFDTLPATLPLIVLSAPGTDHLLTLLDAETGQPALAGYARGGEPFRVLVPPGTYRLDILSGRGWNPESGDFDEVVSRTVVDEPLRFGAGYARRNGHRVDLRGRIGPQIDARAVPKVDRFALCQTVLPDYLARQWDWDQLQDGRDAAETDLLPVPGPAPYGRFRDDLLTLPCD